MRSANLTVTARRIAILRALLLLAFLGLSARASYLTLLNDQAIARADHQILTSVALSSERGKIFDRRGTLLAVSIDTPSVYALRSDVVSARKTARGLARILHQDPATIEKRLSRSYRGNFVFIKRWISRKQAGEIRTLNLPGVGIKEEPKRTYPGKTLAANVLGFTNIDEKGVRGIEKQADRWLRGKPRRVGVERDAHGRIFFDEGVDPHSLAGNELQLTIDARYQASAEANLEKALAKTGAKAGIIVTLDPRTGEILALAERPSFDPNTFRKLSYPSTRSRAFLDAYEPGSTFKTFLIAGALDAKAISPQDEFDCENGAFRIPGRTIHDAHPEGILDVTGILRASSNIGATKIAFRFGPKNYHETLRRFGFAQRTGSGFPNESKGLMRDWRKWRPVDHANIAFGQGVSTTAIQLAAATAALANQGIWITPHLIKARRAPGKEWVKERGFKTHRAVKAKTAAAVRSMMEAVVSSEGTARLAGLADLRVGGKTGTAQKFDPELRRYSNTRYLAWFAGIVPIDNPKLVVVTLLDEPQGPRHGGGDVAAPLFAHVAAEQLRWEGIYTHVQPKPHKRRAHEEPKALARATPQPSKPENPVQAPHAVVVSSAEELIVRAESAAFQAARPLPSVTRIGSRLLLPDLHGLSLAQVKQVTESIPLTLKLSGQGVVVEQEPAPGSILAGEEKSVSVYFGNPRSEL